MKLHLLTTLLPPPQNPVETGTVVDWPLVEQRLGVSLPTDYKAYIHSYGTGTISRFLRPHNPFNYGQLFNFFYQLDAVCQTRRWYVNTFGADWCPYNLYPEPDGLIPWGNTLDGDHLFWLPTELPIRWQIVLFEGKSKAYEIHQLTMTGFIAKLLRGTLSSIILGELDLEPVFEVPPRQ